MGMTDLSHVIDEFTIHMVQNAGIVQALCNIPGSKDSVLGSATLQS